MWHLVPIVSPCGDWGFGNWCKILLWMFIFLCSFLLIKSFVCVQRVYVPLSMYIKPYIAALLLLLLSVTSDSVRPHRWQPTRLPRPWDSPGKNTGVGCHFLLQCMKVKVKVKSLSHVRLLVTPRTAAYQAPPSTGYSRQEYWSGVPLPSLSSLTSKLANMVKSLTLQFLTE